VFGNRDVGRSARKGPQRELDGEGRFGTGGKIALTQTSRQKNIMSNIGRLLKKKMRLKFRRDPIVSEKGQTP